MDPSIILCNSENSFETTNQILDKEEFISDISYKFNTQPFDLFLSKEKITKYKPIYCDSDMYNILSDYKSQYKSTKNMNHDFYPFNDIGNSIFDNNQAITLANIDAIFQITNDVFSFDHQYSKNKFKCCNLSNGMEKYINYRYSDTYIFDYFDIENKKYTSSINTQSFIKNIRKINKSLNDIDLVICNFVKSSDSKEFDNLKLFIQQIIIGLQCTKNNGNFIIKTLNTNTEISAQIIYLLSQYFESISFFKPTSSNHYKNEKYIICKNKKFNISEKNTNILYSVLEKINKKNIPKIIFKDELPRDFKNWLIKSNNYFLNYQLIFYEKLYNPEDIKYFFNIYKFLKIWNLPSD